MKIEIINQIADGFKTFRELRQSTKLINQSHRVNMWSYADKDDIWGKEFGPRGWKEDESGAVTREIGNSQRIKVMGIDEDDTVIDTIWIINRKK